MQCFRRQQWGLIVALIGLELAGSAASTGGIVSSGEGAAIDPKFVFVFIFTLALAVIGQVVFRGFAAAIAILIAIVSGYVLAAIMGLVDFAAVSEASVFALPAFMLPKFNLSAIIIIIPASLTVISEHISHQIVTSEIIDRDLLRDPGLHRSLISDGISTMLSGLCGSVPTTTYGENIGVMAVTKVYSVWVIGGAAVFSILSVVLRTGERTDQYYTGTCNGRYKLPSLRNDSCIRYQTSC